MNADQSGGYGVRDEMSEVEFQDPLDRPATLPDADIVARL